MTRIAMLALALVLGGCGSGKTDERDTAAGKILPGSASDAMLQTDRLQSEAPLAAPKAADGDAEPGTKGAKAAKGAEAGVEPDVAAAPEAEAVAPAAVSIPAVSPATPPAR